RTLSMLYSDLSANLKAVPLSLGEFDLSAILKERVRFFELLAAKKNLEFSLDMPQNLVLKTDEYRISKIIDNLLSNAIKYSNKGEKIYISLNENGINVAQKGVVIPPEKMSKIYDKFTRFDSTNGGFGVGLSLVKTYCCELRYSINCSSSEEQTKFSVSFKKT
ncbi:MAG: HAMP domain-containing histidine kinase, partial [Campylobacter sp.]|nr:HAMP domain-containing histidine kinase [Campylobacter sp.]